MLGAIAGALPTISAGLGIVSGVKSLFGGGSKGGGGGGGGSAAMAPPIDYYAKYGAMAAAANSPITLAGMRYGTTVQGLAGAQGLLGSTLSTGSATALRDAAERGQLASQAQAGEAVNMIGKGLDLQKNLGDARLSVALLDPQFMSQAATAARQGDNSLAKSLGETNLGIRALQESAKTNIAQQYARDLGAMAQTRATGAANLALGAQRIAGDLAKYDASIVGGLTLNKAKTESDIARIRANVGATKDLRQNAMNIAMTGQRFFG